jgi:trans-2,3-dihydro-3-hydroxyanthranilate isomerase
MGAYWASRENNQDIDMVIEQGYEMGRPSIINVEVSKQRDKVQKIRVGGQTQPVFTGRMNLAH